MQLENAALTQTQQVSAKQKSLYELEINNLQSQLDGAKKVKILKCNIYVFILFHACISHYTVIAALSLNCLMLCTLFFHINRLIAMIVDLTYLGY